MMSRVLNEAKARRYEVGVMVASSSALEPLSREKLLTEVKSPLLADLIPGSIAPHREWASVYLNTFVQAYNTKLVNKDELPKTYRDLLNPRWKGRLAVEAEDYDWFAQVVLGLGEAQGLKLFRDIVATNGISVRRGHSVLNNLIVAGEVPLGLSAYGFLAEQAKLKGAPLDWFVIPPLLARPTVAGVVAQCAAAARRRAVLRFPDRRGAADPGEPAIRVAEPQDRLAVHRAIRCSSSTRSRCSTMPRSGRTSISRSSSRRALAPRKQEHCRTGSKRQPLSVRENVGATAASQVAVPLIAPGSSIA